MRRIKTLTLIVVAFVASMALTLTVGINPAHAAAEISVKKMYAGESADSAPGPTVKAGDSIKINYTVKAIGSSTLYDIVVTDSAGVTPNCDINGDGSPDGINIHPGPLEPGQSFTCQALTKVAPAEGTVASVGMVKAIDFFGTKTFSAQNPAHYTLAPAPTTTKAPATTTTKPKPTTKAPTTTRTRATTQPTEAATTRATSQTTTRATARTTTQSTNRSTPQSTSPSRSRSTTRTPTSPDRASDTQAISDQRPSSGTQTNETASDGLTNLGEGSTPYFDHAHTKAKPGISLDVLVNGTRTSNSPVEVSPGSDVIWSFVINNEGNTELQDIHIGSVDAFNINCGDDSSRVEGGLQPGQTTTCTATTRESSRDTADEGLPIGSPMTKSAFVEATPIHPNEGTAMASITEFDSARIVLVDTENSSDDALSTQSTQSTRSSNSAPNELAFDDSRSPTKSVPVGFWLLLGAMSMASATFGYYLWATRPNRRTWTR